MIDDARFVHTNLIDRDWKTLARFYREVCGIVAMPPKGNVIELQSWS
jgi:hypothetical protein